MKVHFMVFFVRTVLQISQDVYGQIPTGQPSGQPSQRPTGSPTYDVVGLGNEVNHENRRFRKGGLCDNACSGHGYCNQNSNCECFVGLNGEPEWTGPDCSLRTCPKDFAWISEEAVAANDMHPWVECSNKGICDRSTGLCKCFPNYDGLACQRSTCPYRCNYRGYCFPMRLIADKAGRVYSTPWDAQKVLGCLCDPGYRGPACELQECPSKADPMNGYGNEAGRDCSGRGVCDYSTGICSCFPGFAGNACHKQLTFI